MKNISSFNSYLHVCYERQNLNQGRRIQDIRILEDFFTEYIVSSVLIIMDREGKHMCTQNMEYLTEAGRKSEMPASRVPFPQINLHQGQLLHPFHK